MNQIATVTSKGQLTIPVTIARKLGVKSGEKVNVIEENGRIIITPLRQLVKDLAGSINIPKQLKEKGIDEVIREAKERHFHSKYKSKKI